MSSFSYEIGAVIQGSGMVTNLDFHSDGKYCVVGTNEHCIHLLDCLNGEEKKKISVKTYGVGQLKYTHHEMCVLVSSEHKTNDVRYLSLHDNRYLRCFQGHTDTVTSISQCPLDDNFLTASEDRTIRKWDLSTPHEIASIQLPPSMTSPFTAYDSSGLVFGVMAMAAKDHSNHCIRLYDAKQSTAPFQVIAPSMETCESILIESYPLMDYETRQRILQATWTSFQFSSDGTNILVNTDQDYLWILDGFRPDHPPRVLGPRKNEANLKLGSCFATDCRHVLVGNDDNEIQVFQVAGHQPHLEQVGKCTGHLAPIAQIAFNPRYDMFVAGCINTALWIPKQQSSLDSSGGFQI